MKKIDFTVVFCIFCFVLSFKTLAQDSIQASKLKIDFSGYIETYYCYDFNRPTAVARQNFIYNYNRHNEFNFNIALLRTVVSYENFYANIAIHEGTYVTDNYAAENLKLFNEAYVGAYLDHARKASLDVGIFASNIGFESPSTAANLTLTRSLLSENTPSYLSGVRLSYKPNNQWTFVGIIDNGWQRISKPNRKALPAFGSQIVYKTSVKSIFNWSTFIGDEPIEENLRTRYYNNFFWDYQWTGKFRTITGFDIGYQKKMSEKGYSKCSSPVLIGQYTINKKWQTAVRTEYYEDPDNVIIAFNSGNFKVYGNSLNVDFLPNSKVKLRTEARWLHSAAPVFVRDENLVKDSFFVTTSLSLEW